MEVAGLHALHALFCACPGTAGIPFLGDHAKSCARSPRNSRIISWQVSRRGENREVEDIKLPESEDLVSVLYRCDVQQRLRR
ncbi:hypothetical protein BKA61DRAFT_614049 [Leptodontidium sp. MPI-SDFR-AT-0119]|nr:hypothetical protein BKA61DRAFT_614049 [Leptodontidium sp. MPI-SDFR-AT-0119]